jgi:hypothetical protein
MWTPIRDDRFGIMKSFSDSIAKAMGSEPHALPDLRTADTIITTSDYSGQHKASRFEAYSFLSVNPRGWPAWESRRLELRRFYRTEGRRMSFKGLGDARKRRMLPDFLAAANTLPGLCNCVLIDKTIPSMFRKEGPLNSADPELQTLAQHTSATIEKLLRVVHLVSFFLAGLSREGQNLFWFTDQDDIAANEKAVIEVTEIWSNILSHYLQHTAGHLKFGTTRSDNGSLQLEDLATIPDLVAGALMDVTNQYRVNGTLPTSEILVPPPQSVSRKSTEILGWLSDDSWPLRRMVYVFEANVASTAVTIKRLQVHGARLLR